jgi:hypothetical protein
MAPFYFGCFCQAEPFVKIDLNVWLDKPFNDNPDSSPKKKWNTGDAFSKTLKNIMKTTEIKKENV